MKNTPEQDACVALYQTKEAFKVEAVAGSGKTTTVRIMAEADESRRALYLAFNKAAADEASSKMPDNTTCRTTHSIAYRAIIGGNENMRSKLSRPPYNPATYFTTGNPAGTIKEIKMLAKVKDILGANKLVISRIAKQTVACFEASAEKEIREKHIPYAELVKLEKKAQVLETGFSVSMCKKQIVACAKTLWDARINERNSVVMTHDTYLKLYQLSNPVLDYDVIFLDEAQDTSDCVIDIVQQQVGRGVQVVCVGDTYQSIYGWRGAVNALAKIDTKSTPLSQSWRYGPEVAEVATHILDGAMNVKGAPHLDTKVGKVDTSKPYTQLFRTNIKLIQQGVKLIRTGVNVRMDVDVRGYVKLLESMVALKYNRPKEVKHEDVVIHSSWEDLLEEAQAVGGELKLLSGLVEKGNVEEVLNTLQVHSNPRKAHVILTTAHKSKGMEYEQVILADDFMDVYDEDKNYITPSDMERNLLYVAATRAVKCLQLNTTVKDIIQHRKDEDRSGFSYEDEKELDEEVGLLHSNSLLPDTLIQEKFDKAVRSNIRSLQDDMRI